ncbi:MAG: hypothetical protein PHS80_02255 [Methanothrix sp.]|nr:hypothetical protein [Methanothrix sp.]MDD4447614.1 hypothetical protein [Methanothrix sp.]
MRSWIFLGMLAFFMITMLGTSQSSDETTLVNLMIESGMPASAAEEQVKTEVMNLSNVYKTINERGLVATIFPTQDVVKSYGNLLLTRIGSDSEFELAMTGNHSNEKLSSMSFAEQSIMLKRSKQYVESCKICGKNEINVTGFMPPSFDQNKDTYRILEGLDILYNAGFQAGLLFAPGHERDVWPYKLEGYSFYAVPVSTYDLSDKIMVLKDSSFKDNGFSATQWYDALIGKFNEIQGKDEPLIVVLTTSVSGSGDYLDSLSSFLDYATSKKARFVTTANLVSLAKAGSHDPSLLPTNVSRECLTCGQDENLFNITASINRVAPAANNTTQIMTS